MVRYIYEKNLPGTRIQRNRDLIDASKQAIAVSRSAIDHSREAMRFSNADLIASPRKTPRDVRVDHVRTLLANIGDEAIGTIVEDFSVAYLEAVATGNEEIADLIRKALTILGRHLAGDLGPRAAGVPMN